MTPPQYAALAAQVNALDQDPSRSVARLVLECRSRLELALLAVQEADRTARQPVAAAPQPPTRGWLA